MRVLHVGSGNLYGGIETLLATLARCRGLCPTMEPTFGLCFEGRLAEELRHSGVSVVILGTARASRPWTIWRVRRAFASCLGDCPPDVIVCHGPWTHAIFAPVAKRFGVPLAFWAHGPLPGKHWVERWAKCSLPDLVIVNSRWTRGQMQLFPSVPTEVLYLPVADNGSRNRDAERREVRAEFGVSDETVVIVQVSRLEAWKGHTKLLDALGKMHDGGQWECWIVGGAQRPEEARYLADLKAQAARDGINSRVRFLGQRQDVPRILAAADIFCQPNLSPEPFGIVFIEALLSGLPLVTFGHGGALEIADDTCALLSAPGDTEALGASLRSLALDDPLRGRLGRAGPARARALCDPETAMNRLNRLLAGAWVI